MAILVVLIGMVASPSALGTAEPADITFIGGTAVISDGIAENLEVCSPPGSTHRREG